MARAKIIAIIGPKGGVGKTTISANLAVALSQRVGRVIAVDLDLGAANLHALFGIRQPRRRLDDFVFNRVENLSEVVFDTEIRNLSVICGGDVPGITNMAYQKKMRLMRHLAMLDCDVVLLDLAPGVSYNVSDFAIIADVPLLVTTPEIPSLMNVYSFIKSVVARRLLFFFKRSKAFELVNLLDEARDFERHPQLKTMAGFFAEARRIAPETADAAAKIIQKSAPFLIVNRVAGKDDFRAGQVIRKMLREFLSMDTTVTKTIREDRAVGEALASMKPIVLKSPNSLFATDIGEIASELRDGGKKTLKKSTER